MSLVSQLVQFRKQLVLNGLVPQQEVARVAKIRHEGVWLVLHDGLNRKARMNLPIPSLIRRNDPQRSKV